MMCVVRGVSARRSNLKVFWFWAIAATTMTRHDAASFQCPPVARAQRRRRDDRRTTTTLPTSIEESTLAADVLGAIDQFYRTAPYEAAFVTCGVKASASDAIAQRAVEKADGFGFRRNGAFIAYGGLYQGVAQYFIYNELYPILFGDGTDPWTVAAKVAFDQLVLTPFLCLPMAYLVKAAVFGRSAGEGLAQYAGDAKKDLLWKFWGIWTPTQCVTFSIVPEHLRIPFIAAVSFFWLVILSNITARKDVATRTENFDRVPVIGYDEECLVLGELYFSGPASLINEDASDTGVRMGPTIPEN